MLEALLQLPIGFFVALSGALIPGPLLAFIAAKSTEEGGRVGPMTVIGHLLVEIFIIFFLLVGIGYVLVRPTLERAIGLMGGTLLMLLSILNIRSVYRKEEKPPLTFFHPIIGGVLFSSVFNPTVPLWWVGVGFALLLEAYSAASYIGVFLWLIGHYMADFGWFSLVSYSISRRGHFPERPRRMLFYLCIIILFSLGFYLLVKYSFFF